MAEDWEDWENDDFTPQLPAATPQPAAAGDDDVAAAKFAGEDEEEEKPQYNVPKPQQVRQSFSSTQRKPLTNVNTPAVPPICYVGQTRQEKDI